MADFSPSRVEKIDSRADLVDFIKELRDDCLKNSLSWENRDLPSFLGALAAWAEDMDGYYKNCGKVVPSAPNWRTFAKMLAAARAYE
jgi:hypothetical protein